MVILQTILTANVDHLLHPCGYILLHFQCQLKSLMRKIWFNKCIIVILADITPYRNSGYQLFQQPIIFAYIIHSLPVKHFLPWLQRFSPKEIIVLRPPHSEILDELDGVAPLLVSVGPEHGCKVGQVDGILQLCNSFIMLHHILHCYCWNSEYVDKFLGHVM